MCDMKVRRIEIDFAIPVNLTHQDMMAFDKLVQEIAKRNEPEHHFHWAAGNGAKPIFSQADQRFLGKEVDPNAPLSGEPTFDEEIYYIETACRAQYQYHCKVCKSYLWEVEWRNHPHKSECEMVL